jgi:hypothetical protein
MLQLSLHVLDVAENSTRAGAKLVTIVITEDGRGMSEEALRKALDPFYTTKKVRRVGLGLPMLSQAARQCGGRFELESEEGVGTKVCAEFRHSHIDRQPLGDIAGAMVALIVGNPDIDFVYTHYYSDRVFSIDTREIKKEIDDIPINHPDILKFIRDSIKEGLEEVGVN